MKITIRIAMLFVLALAGLQVVAGYREANGRLAALEREWRTDQELLATALAPLLRRTVRLEGRDAAIYTLTYLGQFQRGRGFRWVGFGDEATERPQVERSRIALHSPSHHQTILDTDVSGRRRLYTYAIVEGDEGIELFKSLPTRRELFERLFRDELRWALLYLLGATVLVLLLGMWRLARPLDSLIAHVDEVGGGNLDARVSLRGNDELSRLARAMNEMARRLDAARRRVQDEHAARLDTLEQLRRSERLATTGQLAAGVAHEIGTPLTVIRGRAEMLARKAQSDKERKHAEIVVEQVDRISTIVRNLLTFARQDGPSKVALELPEVAREVQELLEPEAAARSITLVVEHDPDVRVLADRAQLHQVLLNLVMNALHASDQGEVRIECRAVGDVARLIVQDEGAGISPDALDDVFTPFFTTKRPGEGTGLGLAIARGIVQDHGGTIAVESSVGEGARFIVELPRVE